MTLSCPVAFLRAMFCSRTLMVWLFLSSESCTMHCQRPGNSRRNLLRILTETSVSLSRPNIFAYDTLKCWMACLMLLPSVPITMRCWFSVSTCRSKTSWSLPSDFFRLEVHMTVILWGTYLYVRLKIAYRSIYSRISISVMVDFTSAGYYHSPGLAMSTKYYWSYLTPQPVFADTQKILSNFPYFSIYRMRESNFRLLSTRSILFRTNDFMKLGYARWLSSRRIDYLTMSSNRLALSTIRREKSIWLRTLHPLDTNPSFLYMSPGVSMNLICTFLVPSSVSLSQDLSPVMISVVVAYLDETALMRCARAPNSQDLPALTGPISPTFRVQELTGLTNLDLYSFYLTSWSSGMSFYSGISYLGDKNLTGRPRGIIGYGSVSLPSGYCSGQMTGSVT